MSPPTIPIAPPLLSTYPIFPVLGSLPRQPPAGLVGSEPVSWQDITDAISRKTLCV